MTGKISKALRIHIKIFKLFGYCTLSFDDNFKRSSRVERWLTLYTIVLLIAFNVIAILAFTIKDVFCFTTDIFGYFNDIIKVIFADIAVTVSFLEAIFKRSALYDFWKIYGRLQKTTPGEMKQQYWKEIWKNRRFLGIFYSLVILELLMLLIFINTQKMTQHLILFWGIFTPFIYAVHIRNIQFMFYIELMRIELVKLKKDLSLMADYSRFMTYGSGFKGFEEFLRASLVEKQRDYQMIYEMYEQFQNSFGFSIIFVLLMIYIRVLVDAYFAYYTVYNWGWNKTELILLIPACLEIPAFLITSKNCMDVVKLITHNLHSIITQFDNQNTVLSTQLQNFSLQILHQRICINGIGISRMDGYMLTRTIGSVTTYMIFYVQFMPKFSDR